MGLEGRKVSDNVVMFGEPVSERALKALQNRSPTADSILSSLPPSAFIPINAPEVKDAEVKEEVVEQPKIDTAKERRKRKRLKNKNVKKEQKPEPVVAKQEENVNIPVKTTLLNNIIEEKNNMNLEQELEALSQKAEPKAVPTPEPQVEEVQQYEEPDLKSQIFQLLENEENAPSADLIQAWKDQYGRSGIHVMAFGEGEVYIYHHLTRGEWKKLKELMAKLQESENADQIEEQLKEKVVVHCILWPSVDMNWLDKCKAGVVDSLYQMILLNSGFLTPQQAMLLTTQL